jgi:hypothetical protein
MAETLSNEIFDAQKALRKTTTDSDLCDLLKWLEERKPQEYAQLSSSNSTTTSSSGIGVVLRRVRRSSSNSRTNSSSSSRSSSGQLVRKKSKVVSPTYVLEQWQSGAALTQLTGNLSKSKQQQLLKQQKHHQQQLLKQQKQQQQQQQSKQSRKHSKASTDVTTATTGTATASVTTASVWLLTKAQRSAQKHAWLSELASERVHKVAQLMHKFNEVQLQLSELKAEKAYNVSTLYQPFVLLCFVMIDEWYIVRWCVHRIQCTYLRQLCKERSDGWVAFVGAQ